MQSPATPVREPATEGTPRQSRTARDMALSLLVLLIPVALVVTIFRLRGGEDVVVVDPSAAVGQAQAAGLFPVAVPHGLDPGWRPVSAAFDRAADIGTLRVGYLSPSGGAAQVLQTNEDPQSLLPREFGTEVQPTGQVSLAGTVWRSYRIRGHQQALVLTTGARTIVVQGAATLDDVRALGGSLG